MQGEMGQVKVRWGGVSHAGVGWVMGWGWLNEFFLQFIFNLLQMIQTQEIITCRI